MKRHLQLIVLIGCAMVMGSCGEDRVTVPEQDPASTGASDFTDMQAAVLSPEISIALRDRFGAPAAKQGSTLTSRFERELLTDDVAHYSFEVRFGPGEHDRLKLHRVVKERRPYRPIKARNGIFLVHGSAVAFETKFLFGAVAPNPPFDQSAAVFWAENNLDVWGIDQPWSLVPSETTDFGFMADWDMQFALERVRDGMGVARTIRLFTGSGLGRMTLLGYSAGCATGYAYLNDESQRPPWQRHAKAYVSVEYLEKYDVSVPEFEEGRLGTCAFQAQFQAMLDAGMYNAGDLLGTFFLTVGALARTDPDGMTPIPDFAGLTNQQVAVAFGALPTFPLTPWFHWIAGVYAGDPPFPVSLTYTEYESWLDFLTGAFPYEPTAFVYDLVGVPCDEEPFPYDDHLADITVPVFYVGARGGVGAAGFYTLDLLGSSDVTRLNVSDQPVELFDFGHIDLWTAGVAEGWVWQPILDWVVDRATKESRVSPDELSLSVE